MERQLERNLEILTAIGGGAPLTQRALAKQLGVAVGLTNLLLKRLAGKGFIKVMGFSTRPAARKRLRYVLTPRGMAEKTRLSYEYMAYSLRLLRRTRAHLREAMEGLPARGVRRVALYGVGEAGELAYLTLRECGLDPIGVFAPEAGGTFLGFPVRAASELAAEAPDVVVVATFERPEQEVAALLRLGLARAQVVTLRRLTATAVTAEGPAA
jgi:DNA-binding MarR family transcriptional regulator